jgi:PAS domain S-box-containing protein
VEPNLAIPHLPDFEKILNATISGVALFKKLTDSKNSIIDFEFEFINLEAQRFFKKTNYNFIGKTICSDFPGFISEVFFDLMVTTLKTGNNTHKEEYYNHKGLASWFKFTATKYDKDHVVVTMLDISKRKIALREAHENQNLLLQTQKAAHVGSFSWNIQTKEFSCTEEFRNLLEFENNDLISFEKFVSRFKPEDQKQIYQYIDLSQENPTFDIEAKVKTPSNKLKFLWINANISIDNNGIPEYFTGTLVNITEKKIAKIELSNANHELNKLSQKLVQYNEELEEKIQNRTRELELSNERFRLLSLATNDIPWDWDFVENKLLFNETFEIGFGFRLQDIVNHYEFWKSRIHAEDIENVENSLKQALVSKDISSWKTEYRFLNAYGSYEPILDRGYIIRNEKGKPIRFIGAMLKISNIEQLQERLIVSEQIHHVLADSMAQLVFSINEHGEGDYFNKRWYEFTGKNPYDIFQRKNWGEIIHPDDNFIVYERWRESRINYTNYTSEVRLRDKNGNYRWFLSIAVPIKNEQGKIIRWIGTSTDIHEHKTRVQNLENIEKQLNHDLTKLSFKNQKLELQNKDMDNFIHVASHDLRSPIKNMDYLLDQLDKSIKPYQGNQDLQDVFKLVQKTMTVLNTLVFDLTEVPIINQNSTPSQYLSLDTIYQEIITSIGDMVEKNKPSFHTDFQISTIKISPKEIRSIFYNLISNAIKYRSEEKIAEIYISCKLSTDNKNILLQVRDNGVGIKKSELPYIFVPFKRLHKIGHGMGLGLSNIKKIIEKHGGNITVESNENQGALFSISFPVALSGG